MKWVSSLVKFLEHRKGDAHARRRIDLKRRKSLDLVEFKCMNCGHHKAFRKDGYYKCTKCGTRSKG